MDRPSRARRRADHPLLRADGPVPDRRGRAASARAAGLLRHPRRRRAPQPVALRPAPVDHAGTSGHPRGRLHPHRRVPRWRVPAQQCGGRRRHHRAPCDLADARTVDARRAGHPRGADRARPARRTDRRREGARFRERTPGEPFTVSFVGRLARQKAPEVFVAMAARLHAADPGIRFIMHGDGELSPWVDHLVAANGLGAVLERRTSAVAVDRTLSDSHLLVVPSHNEGLTLTTLEAIAHGVPVVSTDVGAQADIVPASALLPRNVHRTVREGARVVAGLRDDQARRELWRRERKAERALLKLQSASDWFTEEVRSW
ncbi:MAG: glycosyltransferase [Microbacterium sp.]